MIRLNVRLLLAAFTVASALMTNAACAAPSRYYVRVGPPAPIVEAHIVAPGPGYVWLPGYYAWDGGRYAWRPGVWMLPPRGRAAWVQGHWAREPRGWFWVEGHWR
jgi:hypothetical protein